MWNACSRDEGKKTQKNKAHLPVSLSGISAELLLFFWPLFGHFFSFNDDFQLDFSPYSAAAEPDQKVKYQMDEFECLWLMNSSLFSL